MELLYNSLSFQSTVAVDDLYSLLSLAGDVKLSERPDLLTVDYTASLADVSINFTPWTMLNGSAVSVF
jgi:hypothetical protein